MAESEQQVEANWVTVRIVARVDESPYRQALVRLERAATRFNELAARIREVESAIAAPTARIDREDAERGEYDRVEVDWPPFANLLGPEELSLAGSEILHAIRSCVDFIVHEAIKRDSGKSSRKSKFPAVATEEAWYDATQNGLKGLSSQHIQWIRDAQPFEGQSWSGDLVRFSNTDKHRSAVDLAPVLQFSVDRATAHPIGNNPDKLSLRMSDIKYIALLSDEFRQAPIHEVFPEMLIGAANLLNKFRQEHGEQTLDFTVNRVS